MCYTDALLKYLYKQIMKSQEWALQLLLLKREKHLFHRLSIDFLMKISSWTKFPQGVRCWMTYNDFQLSRKFDASPDTHGYFPSMWKLIWGHYPALLGRIFHYNLTDRKTTDCRSAILQTRRQIKALLLKEHILTCTTVHLDRLSHDNGHNEPYSTFS